MSATVLASAVLLLALGASAVEADDLTDSLAAIPRLTVVDELPAPRALPVAASNHWTVFTKSRLPDRAGGNRRVPEKLYS